MPDAAVRSGPLLLLVEDSLADATLLTSQFESNGFSGTIEWVQDGALALDYLYKRNPFADAPRPDLIILDLNLPKVNGRDVLRDIRLNKDLRSLPVIVLSTSNREEDLLSSYGFGAFCFLTKPADLAGFDFMVDRLLKVELPRAMGRGAEP